MTIQANLYYWYKFSIFLSLSSTQVTNDSYRKETTPVRVDKARKATDQDADDEEDAHLAEMRRRALVRIYGGWQQKLDHQGGYVVYSMQESMNRSRNLKSKPSGDSSSSPLPPQLPEKKIIIPLNESSSEEEDGGDGSSDDDEDSSSSSGTSLSEEEEVKKGNSKKETEGDPVSLGKLKSVIGPS